MGRRFPVAQLQLNHPLLALSFFISCIAATIAIVSPLCGTLLRRKSSTPSATKSETKENPEDVAPPLDEGTPAKDTFTQPAALTNPEDKNDMTQPEDEDYLKQPLPPPPAMLAASNHYRSRSIASQGRLTSSTSKGKLLSSMSMRVIGNAMSLRQSSRREDNDKKHNKKLKHEDSVWKKTIILGEKCKVPDEDDDAILYDEKGNRISAYHPRTPSSLSVSRELSYINQDAFRRSDGN